MNQYIYVGAEEIRSTLEKAKTARPTDNAQAVITAGQKIWMGILGMLILMLSLVIPPTMILATVGIFVTGFAIQFLLKTYLTVGSLQNGLITISERRLKQVQDWPLYSVLIPLRGEEQVIHQLVRAMENLDYPKNKLQVILILEENDPNTVAAAKKIQMPPYFQVLVLADAGPRTKPKACTVALPYVRGEYCVVFDAEDQPEVDQLKKVVLAYEKEVNPYTWCIQGKLEYHNGAQNLLTRLFSGEYITNFNLTIPFLGNQNLLVPLGGTSNHFRTEKLLEMGGWDPYNVTEDLDLGVLIMRLGGNVQVLDSITWEEANSRPFGKGAWISQRSRWIKGYMQSWLVHMRNPWKLLRQVGLKNFVLFQLIVFGSPISLLLSPLFLGLTALYMIARILIIQMNPEVALLIQESIEGLFPTGVYYLSVASFILGNIGIMYYIMTGCLLRGEYGSIKYMFLTPIYWLMMSAAAWKALWQLITKPHYWEKTSHGHG